MHVQCTCFELYLVWFLTQSFGGVVYILQSYAIEMKVTFKKRSIPNRLGNTLFSQECDLTYCLSTFRSDLMWVKKCAVRVQSRWNEKKCHGRLLHSEGKSTTHIRRLLPKLQFSERFVRHTIKRIEETGSIKKRYGGGRRCTAKSWANIGRVRLRSTKHKGMEYLQQLPNIFLCRAISMLFQNTALPS